MKTLFKSNHQRTEHSYPTVSQAKGFPVPRIPMAVTRANTPLCVSVCCLSWSASLRDVFLAGQKDGTGRVACLGIRTDAPRMSSLKTLQDFKKTGTPLFHWLVRHPVSLVYDHHPAINSRQLTLFAIRNLIIPRYSLNVKLFNHVLTHTAASTGRNT